MKFWRRYINILVSHELTQAFACGDASMHRSINATQMIAALIEANFEFRRADFSLIEAKQRAAAQRTFVREQRVLF